MVESPEELSLGEEADLVKWVLKIELLILGTNKTSTIHIQTVSVVRNLWWLLKLSKSCSSFFSRSLFSPNRHLFHDIRKSSYQQNCVSFCNSAKNQVLSSECRWWHQLVLYYISFLFFSWSIGTSCSGFSDKVCNVFQSFLCKQLFREISQGRSLIFSLLY